MNHLRHVLAATLEDIFQQYKGVVVSCSGGADSIGLLHLICQSIPSEKLSQIQVLHINYGLRPKENVEEEIFLSKLCQSLGVYLTIKNCNQLERPQIGVQQWARQIRRQAWQKYLDQGIVVAVAHHMDDFAENLILRMSRGTSPAGWCGLNVWDALIWRPLLGVRKDDLVNWLEEERLSFCFDSSNAQDKYARNQIRNHVLPVLERIYPGAVERICRLGEDVRERERYFKRAQESMLHRMMGAGLLLKDLCELPQWQIFNLLTEAFYAKGGRGQALSRAFLVQAEGCLQMYFNSGSGESKFMDFPQRVGKICLSKEIIRIV
ncbi:MAG: tRNA lysidine(34) synthetase TilS [Zetaproteobacteria bacterium]|nr:tRNA lysidine(34) synthetase TilS [Zetaproteobacteria bacterium]